MLINTLSLLVTWKIEMRVNKAHYFPSKLPDTISYLLLLLYMLTCLYFLCLTHGPKKRLRGVHMSLCYKRRSTSLSISQTIVTLL